MACSRRSYAALRSRLVPSAPVVMPDDMLDPVDFIPQDPELIPVMDYLPVPHDLPAPLIAPPVSRAYLQLFSNFPESPPPAAPPAPPTPPLPPAPDLPCFGDEFEGLENISEFEIREEDLVEEREREIEEAEALNRNWQDIVERDAREGISDLGGSFQLDESSASSRVGEASILQVSTDENISNMSEYLANKSPGSFMIALRQKVRDPEERFRRLQRFRQRVLPACSTPQSASPRNIEEENFEIPGVACTPSPTTQRAMIDAERRFNEILDDSRNYYEANPLPGNLDLVRTNLFEDYNETPPVVEAAHDNSSGFSYPDTSDEVPCGNLISYGSPVRPLELPSPHTEYARMTARSRIQAMQAGVPLPRLPQRTTGRDLEVVIAPEEQTRMRLAARRRAHFLCYPTIPFPEDIVAECPNTEVVNDPVCPMARGTYGRHSLSSQRDPCLNTRANRSLPMAHQYGPVDPVHLRPGGLLNESECGFINQSLPSRAQRFPGECRRSLGAAPSRATARRGSLPGMHMDEYVESCPPEFRGTMGPMVLPEFPDQDRSLIEDVGFDFDNVLDISEGACGTQDTVQVQGPNKSPWKIQIKLMAPTGSGSQSRGLRPPTDGLRAPSSGPCPGPSGISRPSTSGLRPPVRAASGLRPPGRSGIARPAASGLRQPSGICPPGTSATAPAPCPPQPCPAPRQTGMRAPGAVRPPSQPPSRVTSQSNVRRGASQTNMSQPARGASQTNVCAPGQSGFRPPGAGAARRAASQPRPPARAPSTTRAAAQCGLPRTGRTAAPTSTGTQAPSRAASQSRLRTCRR